MIRFDKGVSMDEDDAIDHMDWKLNVLWTRRFRSITRELSYDGRMVIDRLQAIGMLAKNSHHTGYAPISLFPFDFIPQRYGLLMKWIKCTKLECCYLYRLILGSCI